MDELNDVRLAIGTQGHAIKLVREEIAALGDKVDDIGAYLQRLAPLAEFLMDVKKVVEVDIPAAIDQLADDPLIGALISPYTSMLGSVLSGGIARERGARASAPSIEG